MAPSTIGPRFTPGSRENITKSDVDSLGKVSGLPAADRETLSQLLKTQPDRFEPAARRALELGLGVAAINNPTLASLVTFEPADNWGVTFREVPNGQLYVDGISAADVSQGKLGDCFVLAALAGFAQAEPKAISDAITDHGDGTYSVRFYEKLPTYGVQTVVMRVDGTMPTDYDGRLRYAKAPEGELWPAIVEKAYAKFKGGYGAIGSGGSPDDFVFALTGQESSVRWVSLASAQSTFERLKAALDARQVVTVATMPELLRPKGLKLEGLDALHVWFVSRVFESEGQKFVELADPMPSVATRVSTPRGILKLNRHGKMTFTIDEFKAGFPFAFITRPER